MSAGPRSSPVRFSLADDAGAGASEWKVEVPPVEIDVDSDGSERSFLSVASLRAASRTRSVLDDGASVNGRSGVERSHDSILLEPSLDRAHPAALCVCLSV